MKRTGKGRAGTGTRFQRTTLLRRSGARWLETTVKAPELKHRLLSEFPRFIEAEGGMLRQRSLRDRVKKIWDES